ncbi:MAG: hypothetical protein ACE5OZ_25155, partial [Candidatus Heimdallarchaeota archaeon]
MTGNISDIMRKLHRPYLDDPRQNLWIMPLLSILLISVALWGNHVFLGAEGLIWAILCFLIITWTFLPELNWYFERYKPVGYLIFGIFLVFLFILLYNVSLSAAKVPTSVICAAAAMGFSLLIYIESKDQLEALQSYKDAKKLANKGDFDGALKELKESLHYLQKIKKYDRSELQKTQTKLRKYGEPRRSRRRLTSRYSRIKYLKGRQRSYNRLKEKIQLDRDVMES